MSKLFLSAFISGILLTLAYPKFGVWPVAAVAIVPYFYCLISNIKNFSWRQIFLSAFVLGSVWYLSSIWWISYVTFLGMLALSFFIASIFAFYITLGSFLIKKNVNPVLAFVSVWMVFEATLTHFFTGFPWLLLGYSWRPFIQIIQVADVAGVYAVSFLILLINFGVTIFLVGIIHQHTFLKRVKLLIFSAIIFVAIFSYGFFKINKLENEAPNSSVKVACIQANIPTQIKHDRSKNSEFLNKYKVLSYEAAKQKPDVIIWPETAIPGYFFEYGLSYKTVTSIVNKIKIPLLTGLSRYELNQNQKYDFYNSAALISPKSYVVPLYDKMHLVIFGEYVPLEKYLPFLKLVTPIDGSYSSGKRSQLLTVSVSNQTVNFGPLICFEDVFGYLSRKMASRGADILLNLTNDGWFKSSPEPFQHAALASFRAIETRRPLIRATNSGITTIIDRLGKIQEILHKKEKFTELNGILYGKINIYKSGQTIYTRFGDWFLIFWTAVVVILIGGISMPRIFKIMKN